MPNVRSPFSVSGRDSTHDWVVMVPGMHRSGTSLTTNLLSLLGGTLPSRLMPANDSNPEGYFEPVEIAATHDLILKSVGSSWLDWRPLPADSFQSDVVTPLVTNLAEAFDVDFQESSLPLLKDPRLCRLLYVWRDLFAQKGRSIFCVIPYRNPIDVVASLVTRDKLDPYHANLLYLRYSLDAEIASRDLPRIFVAYEDIVADPVSALDNVRSASPFAWPRDVDRTVDAIRSATRDDLRHNRASIESLEDRSNTPAWVHRVYGCYQKLGSERMSIAAFKELDRIRLALDGVSHSSTPLARKIDWAVFSNPQTSAEQGRAELSTLRVHEMQADIASSPSQLDVGSGSALVKAPLDQSIDHARQTTMRLGYLYAALGHSMHAIMQRDLQIARLEKQVATLEKTAAQRIEGELSEKSRLMSDLNARSLERARLGDELLAAQKELQATGEELLVVRRELEAGRRDLSTGQEAIAVLRLATSQLEIERGQFQNELHLAQGKLHSAQKDLAAAQQGQALALQTVKSVHDLFLSSTSWRVTKPMRLIKRIFGKRRGR